MQTMVFDGFSSDMKKITANDRITARLLKMSPSMRDGYSSRGAF